nr:hypothetical protein [Tanacetum cinerariifolium]
MSVSKKKAPAKIARSKGIELLYDAALLEEAQLKRALRRSKRKTTSHKLGGSSEGDNFELDVPDELKGKLIYTSKGTSLKPEEEYERINEELYGDVNVSLKNVEPDDEEKGNKEMTNADTEDVEHENVIQESAVNQVKDDDQEIQKTEVSVIPEHIVANPPKIVTTTLSTTISSLLTSLFPHLQQLIPIPTPPTTDSTTSTTAISESETLVALQLRVIDLKKDVKELKDVDNSTKIISTIQSKVPKAVKEYLGSSLDDAMHKVIQKNVVDIIKEYYVPQYAPQKSVEDIREIKREHARKQKVPKETITSSNITSLAKFYQNTTLFETMTKSKSFNKSPKQKAMYHALMESILEDEDAMDEGVVEKLKRRKPDDADKDEGPFAGSDRGLKRQKTSKYTEPSKKAKLTKTSKVTSIGTSKSQPKFTPQNQGQDMGNTDDQPNVEAAPKRDWFKKPERPPTPDSNWNVRKTIDFRPPQTWISKIAQAEKPHISFDELISTPIDFSAYVMNYLKIDYLTQDHLVGLVFNLLKGTCKSHVELEYNIKECYKAVTDRLDYNNPKGKEYLFHLSKPLSLIMEQGCQVVPVNYFFNNDL